LSAKVESEQKSKCAISDAALEKKVCAAVRFAAADSTLLRGSCINY